MPVDMDRFWDAADDEPKRPGVSDEQIAAWEGAHGVKLPQFLRDVLRRQDGGEAGDGELRLLPLEEIKPPDADFFSWVVSDGEAPNRDWLLAFAWGPEEPMYLMNFNANGPQGEPSVHEAYHDPGDLNDIAPTLDIFFSRLLDVSEAPAVDWSETGRLEVVLFREKVDRGDGEHIEMVLGRRGGVLVLYTHEPASAILTKTILPEPISTSVEGAWPIMGSIHMLNLEPEAPDGINSVESKRTADGNWKNRTEHGGPAYVTVESTSAAKLQALRETLVGKAAVRKEDFTAWWWTWVIMPLCIALALPCLVLLLIPLIPLLCLRVLWWMLGGFRRPHPSPDEPTANV